MKKNTKYILTSAFISLFSCMIFGQALAESSNVGVINIEKIAKESVAVQDIQAKVTKKQDEFQAEINKKQKSLEAEQKKIESRKNILSESAFEKEQQKFEEKVNELKDFVEKKQSTLKKASTESMEIVNNEMKSVIEKIAKEKNLSIILPNSQIVFAVESADITEIVLLELNKKIKKVTVKFQ